MPKALLLTSQFFAYAGSEIVIYEIANCLIERGYTVDIMAYALGSPMAYAATAKGANLTQLKDSIDVTGYDLVWSQHGSLAFIDWEKLTFSPVRPLIVSAHLSPYANLEAFLHPYESRVADLVVFNSLETQKALTEACPTEKQYIFYNACPKDYFQTRAYRDTVKNITVITNHVAGELHPFILNCNRNLGISVNIIGYGYTQKLISPKDIIESDVIITIGKSAQYALASKTPLYIYDVHGGDGWVTRDNIEMMRDYNFSGRPQKRMISSEEILNEIVNGYDLAVQEIQKIPDSALSSLNLDHHLDFIISRSNGAKPQIKFTAEELKICKITKTAMSAFQGNMAKKYVGGCDEIFHKPPQHTYYN